MKKRRLYQTVNILAIAVLLLSACTGQEAAAPTASVAEAAAAASPTPAPVAGIETPIKLAGAELKITLATTDITAYDTGPFSVQTAPGFALMHIEAAVVSGQPDFNALNEGVSLVDGEGKDCPLASMGIEKPMWEFIVPDTGKSFTLKFGDGQVVALDSIFNKPASPAAVTAAEPTPVPSATSIPPTPEPAALIRLGPGKFGKAISLEVLKGRYQISSGDTLLAGSAVAVNEDWLTFPPNLAIDIEGASITLKGVDYPSGSKLITDSSGNLVPRAAGELAGLTQPPADSTPDYVIPAGAFSLDTREKCNTNVTITGVNDKGFKVGGTLSMHNDQFVLWCPGARHTWEGTLSSEGYTFESDASDPLVFVVDPQGGYEYVGGQGKVTQPDGKVVNLSSGVAAAAVPAAKPTSKPTSKPTAKPTAIPTVVPVVEKKDVYPTLFLSDTFRDNTGQWPVGEVDGPWWVGSRLIKNGVLEWDGSSRQGMNSTISPDNPTARNFCSSQEVSVKVKAMNPALQGSFGLQMVSPDWNSFYSFQMTPQGTFSFHLFHEDTWTPLVDWATSPYINNGGWNILSVQADRGHFKLFINDKLLGEVDDSTIPVSAGGIIVEAFQAGEKIKVAFDDFQVRLPATQQAAGCPLKISTMMSDNFSKVLLSDSFDDNSSGWPLGDVDIVYWKGSRSIENGALVWKGVSRSPMSWYVNPDTAVVTEKQSDQLTSVRVKPSDPTMDGSYGLVLRTKELMEGSRFYVFLLDPTGYVSFFLSAGDEWTPLIDWKESPGINPGDWNKLSVEASGSHFRLFLNDTLVGEADDATLRAGPSGVIIQTYNSSVSFDIQFDDFKILLPEK